MSKFLELEAALPHGNGSGNGIADRLPLYTLPEAAAVLGISERTLRAQVNRGDVAAERTAQGHYRLTAATLESLRQRQPDGSRAARGITERQPSGSGMSAVADTAEVEFLRARLVHADEREADLRRQLGDALRLLEAERLSRRPWEPVSLPTLQSGESRRWWAWWRRS